MEAQKLPQPFAAFLARTVAPKFDASGRPTNGPTGDDEVSGRTTWTDD